MPDTRPPQPAFSLEKQRKVATILLLVLMMAATAAQATTSTETWIVPESGDDALVWGHREGLVFGIPSPGGMPGPRGLIRVGVLGKTGKPELINFVAVEPVVQGDGARMNRMGFSELEPSELDPGKNGKRLWVENVAGDLTTQSVEQLSVRIEVEPFSANRARVYVIASVRKDRPGELELAVHHSEGCAPIEELTVTATMGNYERLRHLWLRERVVDSRALYAGYAGKDFVEKETYPLDQMLRTGNGDALALATPSEADPANIRISEHSWWNYKSPRLTQYWRVPAAHIRPDLRVRVNGRRVYWASTTEIPGGPSFENFELRQLYVPGQVFVFGLTQKQPWQFEPPIPKLPPKPD